MDVTTRDLWMWLVLVFFHLRFLVAATIKIIQHWLWRSRRKFFTKSEKSFLEDASKNVIIEVSRCNLCFFFLLVEGGCVVFVFPPFWLCKIDVSNRSSGEVVGSESASGGYISATGTQGEVGMGTFKS